MANMPDLRPLAHPVPIAFDIVDSIIAFEQGELDEAGTLTLFAHLIKTGTAWSLQGFYGRAAKQLIEQGLISPEGAIL